MNIKILITHLEFQHFKNLQYTFILKGSKNVTVSILNFSHTNVISEYHRMECRGQSLFIFGGGIQIGVGLQNPSNSLDGECYKIVKGGRLQNSVLILMFKRMF